MAARRRCALLGILIALALAATAPAAGEIRIGFAGPLSGPYATSGQRNLVAVETAVRNLNRHGGVRGEPVRLTVADDACGLVQAVAAAQKLARAGVGAVIGHFCSHSSLLAAGVYEAADLLMISPSSTHPRLTEEGRGNVFRLAGRDDRQGELAAELLSVRYGEERIAILHDGSTYGAGLARETRSHLHRSGVDEVIYGSYAPGRDEYVALVAGLRRAGIDVLYLAGYGPDAGSIVRAAREQGSDLQLVGGDGVGMEEFWATAGSRGEGTIFSRRRIIRTTPEVVSLMRVFESRGLAARPSGIAAYAAVQVWAEAVERAGTTELAPVARELRRGRFKTILGRVDFDRKGDLRGADWDWHVWRDGSYVPIPWRTRVGSAE